VPVVSFAALGSVAISACYHSVVADVWCILDSGYQMVYLEVFSEATKDTPFDLASFVGIIADRRTLHCFAAFQFSLGSRSRNQNTKTYF
jgi:hypothetical protein